MRRTRWRWPSAMRITGRAGWRGEWRSLAGGASGGGAAVEMGGTVRLPVFLICSSLVRGRWQPLFEGEADLQGDLIAVDLAAIDVAPDLHDLEPSEMPQCLRRLGYGVVDGFGDALVGGADNLDDLVDRIGHFALPGWLLFCCGAGLPFRLERVLATRPLDAAAAPGARQACCEGVLGRCGGKVYSWRKLPERNERWSIQHVGGTDTEGQPFDLTVRVTDGYRGVDGRWLIAQEHISVPVDVETGKPDLMSKPQGAISPDNPLQNPGLSSTATS